MSSEAITRNDLTAILNEVLPPTPSEYRKLLWTNPSPSADFAPQTLALDLSGYDDIEIIATFLGDINNSYAVRCVVGGGSNLAYQTLNTATATNASTFINGVAREFSVSASGITFGNGQMTYNGGAYTNWQGRAIPYKIYGIKYERVAPPQVEYPTYSTEEQQVGTWINGKPIYRKVYTGLSFGGTTAVWADTGATITNVANMISCRGLGADFQPLMGFRVNSNKIQYWCGQSWAGTTSIIIEYTKTTD